MRENVFHNVSLGNLENVLQKNLRKAESGSAFLEYLEATMAMPLWIRCLYLSAQKNPEYATALLKIQSLQNPTATNEFVQ